MLGLAFFSTERRRFWLRRHRRDAKLLPFFPFEAQKRVREERKSSWTRSETKIQDVAGGEKVYKKKRS